MTILIEELGVLEGNLRRADHHTRADTVNRAIRHIQHLEAKAADLNAIKEAARVLDRLLK